MRPVNTLVANDSNPNLKGDKFSIHLAQTLILLELLKNPPKSIKGTIKTGAASEETLVLEKMVPIKIPTDDPHKDNKKLIK